MVYLIDWYLIWQICITTSTSAGLEQILPWLFYHQVIGVTNFFLFVEGKAATTDVSAVLRSIPVRFTAAFTIQKVVFNMFFMTG